MDLVELFYAVSELFILFRHLDEMLEPFLELARPFSGRVDEGDADALVRPGISLEVLPGLGVGPELGHNILRNLKLLRVHIADRRQHVWHDFTLLDQPIKPFFIGLRVAAPWISRRKALGEPLLVDTLSNTVNPTETERFFDGMTVRDTWGTRVFPVGYQPDFVRGLKILFQPFTPIIAIGNV